MIKTKYTRKCNLCKIQLAVYRADVEIHKSSLEFQSTLQQTDFVLDKIEIIKHSLSEAKKNLRVFKDENVEYLV